MKDTTLTLEAYTALNSQEETKAYELQEANDSLSDVLARQRQKERKE